MGCINSKNDLTDINPNIFRVSNIDSDGTVLWSGQLEISRTELTLYRKGKKPTQWPLQCLRRYGYDADLFSFEAGRRCDTGAGIYAFRCRRAEHLFHMLQNYIQGRAYSTDENILNNSNDIVFSISSQQNNINNQASRSSTNNNIARMQQHNNSVSRNNGVTTSIQSLSPNGTVNSHSNQSRSSDTLTADGNYLEPNPALNNHQSQQQQLLTRFQSGMRLNSVSSGPLSPDLASPGSPNSITNILEVTPLPNNHTNHHGVSNLYQEFPINNNNNNNLLNQNKKLSLDLPPQEQAPSRSCSTTNTQMPNDTPNITTNGQVNENKTISPTKFCNLTTISPNNFLQQQYQDSIHSYMNINLGNDSPHTSSTISSSTPTSISNNSKIFGFQTNYQQSTSLLNNENNSSSNRCYENLEPGDMRPLLLKSRFSKPDIFSKIDLPLNTNTGNDKSEPCTPTITKMLNINNDRKVNYIILDLNDKTLNNNINNNINNDNSNSINSSTSSNPLNINITNSLATSNNSTNQTNSMLLLPPESPKNASLGYATIDFNKTVALSNSITPCSDLDSEGSRKTRHSSNIPSSRQSNSISE